MFCPKASTKYVKKCLAVLIHQTLIDYGKNIDSFDQCEPGYI